MLSAIIFSFFLTSVHAESLTAQDVINRSPEIAQRIQDVEKENGLKCLTFMGDDSAAAVASSLQGFGSNAEPTLFKISMPCRFTAYQVPARWLDILYTLDDQGVPHLMRSELRVSVDPQ